MKALRAAINQELTARRQLPLTDAEFLAVLPHENWSVETAANMIAQLRRTTAATIVKSSQPIDVIGVENRSVTQKDQ
jgi:hypothetical protein